MELRHLRYFKAVAEQLNFSRAAEQLHIAQPALSRQIQALENEMGARLLERNRVSVRLTDAGRTFYGQTCKILAQVDMAVAAVHEVAEGTGGELIISHDWHLGGELVSATLAEFRAHHPRAQVVLQDCNIPDQLALLRSRRIHLGFVVKELLGTRRDLRSLFIMRSNLLVALPANHRLSRRSRVRLAELANDTWVGIDPKHTPAYAQYLIRLCRLSGFSPIFNQPATTLEGMLGRVASGYGVALIPEHFGLKRTRQVRYAFTDCTPIELCAAWHRDETSLLLPKYLEILHRHLHPQQPVDPPA